MKKLTKRQMTKKRLQKSGKRVRTAKKTKTNGGKRY